MYNIPQQSLWVFVVKVPDLEAMQFNTLLKNDH